MDKKWYFIIILFLVTIGIFILTNYNKFYLSPEFIEKCNTLEYNSENGINLVFFSTKEQAEEYSNLLLSTQPFKENRESFNVFYIDEYSPECDLYEEKAIFCHSRELIRKASSCPSDYIIALKSYPTEIRSSSFMDVLSINTNHQKNVIAHEFGHTFANLAEEYTPSRLSTGALNCVSNCNKFENKADGCFEGCSKDNYYRSVQEGLMRTLSSNSYGLFDEEIIKSQIKKKSGTITGKAISEKEECSNQNYIMLVGYYNYEENNIEIKETSIEKGCPGTNGNGEFSLELKDSSGNTLIEQNINPSLLFTDYEETAVLKGEVFEYSGEFILTLPIISANYLEITHNNKNTKIDIHNVGGLLCQI